MCNPPVFGQFSDSSIPDDICSQLFHLGIKIYFSVSFNTLPIPNHLCSRYFFKTVYFSIIILHHNLHIQHKLNYQLIIILHLYYFLVGGWGGWGLAVGGLFEVLCNSKIYFLFFIFYFFLKIFFLFFSKNIFFFF